MADEHAKFARAAIELLERENPRAAERVAAVIQRYRVAFEVGTDAFELVSEASRLGVAVPRPTTDVSVLCDSATLKRLLAGSDRISAALLDGRLDMTGTLDALAALGIAFSLFLRGAIACPSFPELYEQYVGTP